MRAAARRDQILPHRWPIRPLRFASPTFFLSAFTQPPPLQCVGSKCECFFGLLFSFCIFFHIFHNFSHLNGCAPPPLPILGVPPLASLLPLAPTPTPAHYAAALLRLPTTLPAPAATRPSLALLAALAALPPSQRLLGSWG